MLNKRETLVKCRQMYWWLGEHTPRVSKIKWDIDNRKQLYFAAYPRLKEPYNLCYACQYNQEHGMQYCGANCILHWTVGPAGNTLYCLREESEYEQWRLNPTRENAMAIVALCDKALAELPPRK